MEYSYGIVPPPKQLAADISKMLPNVKSGSLRFWGEWFGRPYDNCHVVVSCDATEDCLRIYFNEGETLAVWNPIGVQIGADQFQIGDATALRWTWYYYGRSQISENLFYIDYAKQEDGVAFRTNWNQVPGSGTLGSAAKFPAVEMH